MIHVYQTKITFYITVKHHKYPQVLLLMCVNLLFLLIITFGAKVPAIYILYAATVRFSRARVYNELAAS